MAIDLFGHSDYPIAEAQRRIVHARAAHPKWFERNLILYDASDLGPFGDEIAREFGIAARCRFMLSVNDKEHVGVLNDAVEFLYRVFGTDHLVITRGMDTICPPGAPYAPIEIGLHVRPRK